MTLIFGLGLFLLGTLFSILCLVFYIYVIVDCAKNESPEGNTKVVWILVIILTAPLGGIIYYLIRRPDRIATLGQ